MKMVFIFISTLLTVSCSFKKPETHNNTVAGETLKETITDNPTGDGLSNFEKSSLGLNPNVAYFPRLSIHWVKDVNIGAIFKSKNSLFSGEKDLFMLSQQFASTDSTKGGDVDFFKVLRSKILINQYKFLRNIRSDDKDTITDDDLKSSILSYWSDDQYFDIRKSLGQIKEIQQNPSGRFNTNFKIKIQSNPGLNQISNIKLKSFYYDFKNLKSTDLQTHYLIKDSGAKEILDMNPASTEYIPATTYPIFTNEILNTVILKQIINRSEVGMEFEDFEYKILGKSLSYSKIISDIKDKCAKVIISDGNTSEVHYVAPYMKLSDALSILGKKVTANKDGTIESIGKLQTNISQPIDFDSLKSSDLTKGVWSIFGESDGLDSILKPKGFYFISYATMKDIINSAKRSIKLADEKNTNVLTVDGVMWGDELSLNILQLRYKTQEELLSVEEKGTDGPIECLDTPMTPPGRIGNGRCNVIEAPDRKCQITRSTIISKDYDFNFNTKDISRLITLKDEYGNTIKYDLYTYEDQVSIKFNYQLPQFKNQISIHFADSSEPQIALRSGIVSSSCGPTDYTTTNWKNYYDIKLNASIFGALKY